MTETKTYTILKADSFAGCHGAWTQPEEPTPMNTADRNKIAAALRKARKRLSPAQRALRGKRRKYHVWNETSMVLNHQGHFMLAMWATDRAIAGWTRVPARTAAELAKD